MTDKKVAAGVGIALLLAVCGVGVSTTFANDEAETISIPALIRDFSHNSRHFQAYDFKTTQSVAGMTEGALNDSGDPVFTGAGRGGREPATDAHGRANPPHHE